MEIDTLVGQGQLSWVKVSSGEEFSTWTDLLGGETLIHILAAMDPAIFDPTKQNLDSDPLYSGELPDDFQWGIEKIYGILQEYWGKDKWPMVDEEFSLNMEDLTSNQNFSQMTKFLALVLLTVVSYTDTNSDEATRQLMATQELPDKDENFAVDNFLSNKILSFFEKISSGGWSTRNLLQGDPNSNSNLKMTPKNKKYSRKGILLT